MRTGAAAKAASASPHSLVIASIGDAVAGLGVAEVGDGRRFVIADLDQGRRRDRLLESLGNHGRDMLAAEGDVARQRAIGYVRRRRAEPVRRAS